jgi:hypothetical protein
MSTATPAPAGTPASLPGVAAGSPRVLIVNQASPSFPVASDRCGRQTQLLIRHFTPNTTLIGDGEYQAGTLAGFDRIVLIGNDAITPLPAPLLDDLAHAGRPFLWLGYGLNQLPLDLDAASGFVPKYYVEDGLPTWVEYRGHRYPAQPEWYTKIIVSRPFARVYSTYGGGSEPVPYAIAGGDLWYVNGLPNLDSDYPDAATDVPTLILADLLHDFFGTGVEENRRAVVRLEDISVHIDPSRIDAAADHLRDREIPFVMGVIPAQRFADGSIVSLRSRPSFVDALRRATRKGATIALHGYHHTFGSGEDFEFWDEERDAPLAGETWQTYADKVEDGIRILRDQELEPRLWETPHYAASPLAYRVFAHYFSHAIENREPVSWLPYPIATDEYGQALIPENLGYIHPEQGWTVEALLQRASLLQIVRDAWAVGFYHPANIPVSELAAMVDGLRELGYEFADVGALPLQVHYDYRPSGTGSSRRPLAEVEDDLRRWSAFAAGPWALVAFLAFMAVFLVRLRVQWRPTASEAPTLVAHAPARPVDHRRLFRVSPAIATGLALLLAGAWVIDRTEWPASRQPPAPNSSRFAGIQAAVDAGSPAASVATPAGGWVTTDGWEITVYYTVVESFHSGPPEEVRGCLNLECQHGTDSLGVYPSDFIEAVKGNGTGRITSGPHAGEYLNWSIDVGYWLDTIPRDARGLPLIPYLSAAADIGIPYVTPFKVLDCGKETFTSEPIDPSVCARIASVEWVVRDRFTEGKVGKHVDLYVGEEDQPDFVTTSQRVVSARNATISMGTPPFGG